MKSVFKKVGAVFACVVVAAIVVVPIAVRGDVTSAVNYLKGKPLGAWSVMAIAAAGETPDVSSLQSANGGSAIELEAPILALAAAGKDPRSYPSVDLVAKLKSFYNGNQIGDASTLNDDAFGILALAASGEPVSGIEITGAKQFLLSHQGNDGGWPFSVGGASDTNTTAAAASALLEAGVSKNDTAITNAVSYLKGAQNSDGGFPYDPQSPWGTASDASSDAWVISFVNKLGEDPKSWTKEGNNAVDHLLSLQAQEGFFRYQTDSAEDSFSPVTTSYGIIALSGKSFPVGKITAPRGVRVHYRIEGSVAPVCAGDATAVDALSVVKIAAEDCGFTYEIKQLSFGPYLSKIGGDEAAGLIGWLYTVNSVSPDVGAADYKLAADDSVLWYFGDFNWKLTRLTLSDVTAASGGSVTATVEFYENGSWSALSGATVQAGNESETTDSGGKAILLLSDGSHTIVASKSGYVRSNSVKLTVGASAQQEVALSVNVTGGGGGGQQGGTTIAFTIAPSSLGFGNLSAGQSSSKTVTLGNTGQVAAFFEATVTGDAVFADNLTFDNIRWRNFNVSLNPSAAKDVEVKLAIPANFAGAGAKSGNVVFWATVSH